MAEESVAESEVIIIQHEKYNTYLQREVELSPPEHSINEKP